MTQFCVGADFRARSDLYYAALLKASLGSVGGATTLSSAASFATWVSSISAAILVHEATPFVWLNALRRLTASIRHDPLAPIYSRALLVCAFDAYFDQIKNGERVRVGVPADGGDTVLPRLGVRIASGEDKQLVLGRRGDKLLIERSNDSHEIHIAAPPVSYRLEKYPIPHSRAWLLPNTNSALFDAAYIGQIVPNDRGSSRFPEVIAGAHDVIGMVDEELHARIAAGVRWYVPITSPDANTHSSFTSRYLPGVMFLSFAEDLLTLCEAIVHEFGHTELNLVQDCEPLTRNAAGNVFYSPWRRDPRPLDGLIHALWVFVRVERFLAGAQKLRCFSGRAHEIALRRRLIHYRLRVGLNQVVPEQLTATGRRIVRTVAAKVALQRRELVTKDARLPEEIAAHIQQWRRDHPHLAAVMREVAL